MDFDISDNSDNKENVKQNCVDYYLHIDAEPFYYTYRIQNETKLDLKRDDYILLFNEFEQFDREFNFKREWLIIKDEDLTDDLIVIKNTGKGC